MKKQNLTKKPLIIALGAVTASLSLNAAAETITGVNAPYYDPGSFGLYYPTAGGYAGRAYQYAVGLNIERHPENNNAPIITPTNGFGEAGDVWSVRGDEHLMADPMINGHEFGGVGQSSWCQTGACAGGPGTSSGWNNTTQHVLFSVTTEADIKITLANAPSVEGPDGPNETGTGALGNNLIPGFTLYDGYSDQGWGPVTHTYNNTQDFTMEPLVGGKPATTIVPAGGVDMIYRAHNANTANVNSISNTYHLPVGFYSLWLGGNFANTQNTNSDLACLTFNGPGGSCSGNGGNGKNFQLTIETASAVPVPAAAWLFGGALSALGAFGPRRKVAS